MTHIGGVPYNVVTRVNILCIGGLRGRRSIGMRTGRINLQLKRQQQQQKKKKKLATKYILHKNCIMQSMDKQSTIACTQASGSSRRKTAAMIYGAAASNMVELFWPTTLLGARPVRLCNSMK